MHGIGILIFILVRLAVYFSNQRTGQKAASQPTQTKPYVARLAALAVRAAFLSMAWLWWHDSASLAWPILCLICGLPQLVIEFVLIPAGIPHLAYYFTRATYPHAIFGEPRGLAVFNELRARLRWGWRLEPPALARLGKDVIAFNARGYDRTVRAASLTARAMLDALGSGAEGERARELFELVQAMDFRHAARSARVYSQAWLLSDAARRGAYHELIRLSFHGPFTRRRWFMRASARRILGQGEAAANFRLIGWWLLAPARRHGFGLLKRALRAKQRTELRSLEPGLAAARQLTAELMRLPSGAATRDEVAALAVAWQAVFDSGEIRRFLTDRREALQASFDVDAVDARFESQIVAGLSDMLRSALPNGDVEAQSPALLLAAMDQLQGDWLGELEDLCHSLPRGEARSADDLERHWRTWARVRHLASLLSDTLPERAHLVFASVGGEVLNHGAWLYNMRKAQLLAHDMFRFLLAIAPKGDPNFRTIKKNARLSA